MNTKHIIPLLLFILLGANAFSETICDIQIGTGIQTLGSKMSNDPEFQKASFKKGTAGEKWGFNIGGTLNQYFNDKIGFQIGLRYNIFRTAYLMNDTEEYSAFDIVNDKHFTRVIQFSNWNERIAVHEIAIPLGYTIQKPIKNHISLVGSTGVQLMLPIVSRYNVNKGSLNIKGYYDEYDVTFEDMPIHSFYRSENNYKGKAPLKVGAEYYLDAGFRWNSDQVGMVATLFFSYGLNNLKKDDENTHLFDAEGAYSGIMKTNAIQEIHPVAVGIKIGATMPVRINYRK